MDNDPTICQAIYNSMQDEFTEIQCMTSAMEALASYIENDYCLVILDIQLTDVDGIELLRTIRNTKHTPILALTKPLPPKETVALLHAGADTFLEKPLNMDICVAQANTLIQRYVEDDVNHGQHKPVIHGSELIINPRYRRVMINGQHISLTRREFDLLHYFADHQEQVFTCEQLYNQVWGGDSAVVIENIVKSEIKRLRKKLSDVGKNYIRTEWGVGYKFVLSEDD
ncbi:MAG: response regulator transcription factor [Lawsonibacter sp.]|nr:response regulator transcription factor [Lawsonibacter sp.]